jgi:hypothetical protein
MMATVATSFESDVAESGLGHDFAPNHFAPSEHIAPNSSFWEEIANEIVRSLRPRRVLDTRCAEGLLVQAFWDRGVYCEGIGTTPKALDRVRSDVRAYCSTASVADYKPSGFDLILCLEGLQGTSPRLHEQALTKLCDTAEAVLFTANSGRTLDATCADAKPTMQWLELFSRHDFWPDAEFDASFLAPDAVLFRKGRASEAGFLRLFAEYLRHRVYSHQLVGEKRQFAVMCDSANERERNLSQAVEQAALKVQQLSALAEENKNRADESDNRAQKLQVLQSRTDSLMQALRYELTFSEQSNKKLERDLANKQKELEEAFRAYELLRQRISASDSQKQQLAATPDDGRGEQARRQDLERIQELEMTLNSVLNSRAWRLAEQCRVPLRGLRSLLGTAK